MRSSRTVYSFKPLLLLHSPQGAHELGSPRRRKTERGCVEDQPQRVGGSKAPGVCGVLRLVEDDTAALRTGPTGKYVLRFEANLPIIRQTQRLTTAFSQQMKQQDDPG